MKKKIIYGILATFGILLLIGVLNSWHFERLDQFVRVKIEEYARSQLPVDIIPGTTEFSLIPLRLKVSNIKIIPKKELATKLKELDIVQIKLSPSILYMFVGKLHLSYLNIEHMQLKLNIPINSDGPETVINLDKILAMIPISQLKLENVDLELHLVDKEKTYTINASDISSLVTNDVSSLALKLKVPNISVDLNKMSLIKDSQFETHLFLTNKNLILSELKVKEGNSFILASGSTQHILPKKVLKSANINLRAQIDADKMRFAYNFIKKPDEENPLDLLHGQLRTDLQIKSTGYEKAQVLAQGEMRDLAYENFKIGNVNVNGTFNTENKQVVLKKVLVENAGLLGEAQDLTLDLNSLIFTDAKVEIKKFELYKFLEYAINNKVPANGLATGKFTCSGNLKNFKIECPGSLDGKDMHVASGGNKPLADVKEIHADGRMIVDAREVTYTADLKTEKSKGTSSGAINFKNGFDIKYDASLLDFSEIKKISVLEVGGTGQLSGSTQGNSKTAVFEINFDGKNVELDRYKLGDVNLNLSYKSGKLFANKIQGSLVSSRYLGQLEIDLEKDWIVGKVQFPFIDLAVAKEAIKAQLQIPVAIAGSGSAILNIDGPLNPRLLSFKSKSRLYNCKVAEQHFDTVDADLISDMGQVKFNSMVLEEKNSILTMAGLIDLDHRAYNLTFKSQNYHLDDFQYVKVLNAPVKGLLNIDGAIKGTFETPSVEGKVSSTNFNLSGENLSPLNGDFHVQKSKIIADIHGPNELRFMYKDLVSSPDIQIEANSKNLNLAPMVTSFLSIKQLDDYQILTSSTVSVRINKADTTKINGYIFIPSIALQFQKTELRNEKEISLFFTNGKLNFSAFQLLGQSGKLEFKSSPGSASPVDVQVSGLFSLSFLHIFAPFLETLEGLASANVRVHGDHKKLHFIGSSFIDEGFVKLPDIQHAVEELKIDMLFNQDQVIINSIKGKFASGQLLGDGKILLKGKKDIPMTLNVHLDNIDLNLPDQVNTKGSADLQLTGNWLPYTVTGTYSATDGLISKELSGGDNKNVSPHQAFLPQVLRDEASTPVKLDVTFLPLNPIKVKNSMIDGRIEGRIKISGNPQTPVLGGRVALIRNSQIIFMNVVFKVRDSNFTLNNTSPPNPAIYLVAEARYKGYDIEMLVQGTAEKPRFKWSSSPTLTEPEIISLLTLGSTTSTNPANLSQNLNNASSNTSVAQNTQASGAAIFSQNPLSKELKNRFGFDIQFSSKFDNANSVAVPKISLAKQLNERTALIASYQTGRDSQSNYTLQYQLNKEFATTLNILNTRQEDAGIVPGNSQRPDYVFGVDLNFRKDFK